VNKQRLRDMMHEEIVPLQVRILDLLINGGIIPPHYSDAVHIMVMHLVVSILIECANPINRSGEE